MQKAESKTGMMKDKNKSKCKTQTQTQKVSSSPVNNIIVPGVRFYLDSCYLGKHNPGRVLQCSRRQGGDSGVAPQGRVQPLPRPKTGNATIGVVDDRCRHADLTLLLSHISPSGKISDAPASENLSEKRKGGERDGFCLQNRLHGKKIPHFCSLSMTET